MNVLKQLWRLIFKKKDKRKEWRLKIIAFVNLIKQAVESPGISFIVKITKTKSDDTAQKFLVDLLSDILHALELTRRKSPEARLGDAINNMADLDANGRSRAYADIAGYLYHSATGIDLEAATVAIQTEYNATPVDKVKDDRKVIGVMLLVLIVISVLSACSEPGDDFYPTTKHELRKFNVKSVNATSAWYFIAIGGYSSTENQKIRFYYKLNSGEYSFDEKSFDQVNIKIENVKKPYVTFNGGYVVIHCNESDFQPEININSLR